MYEVNFFFKQVDFFIYEMYLGKVGKMANIYRLFFEDVILVILWVIGWEFLYLENFFFLVVVNFKVFYFNYIVACINQEEIIIVIFVWGKSIWDIYLIIVDYLNEQVVGSCIVSGVGYGSKIMDGVFWLVYLGKVLVVGS